LEIPRLRKLVEKQADFEDGIVAQRQILRVFFRTFVVGAALLARNKNTQASWCFEIAAQAAPLNPYIWYDLARAQAYNNQKREALKSLQSAVEKGFNDAARLEDDYAFEGFRTAPDYQKALAHVRGGVPRPKPHAD
jgi:hypothetical protein